MRYLNSKILIILVVLVLAGTYAVSHYRRNKILEKIIERLSADSRVAEALVTDVRYDPVSKKHYTTIKFLEYDTQSCPLAPKYFTFTQNIIQFQAMVIRFDDFYVKSGHPLKGKSASIFLRVFALNGKGAEVCEINKVDTVPSGYALQQPASRFETQLWKRFWEYALNPKEAKKVGIKNAQIEAPGTKFIPGMVYTIVVEHDGGLRVDARPLPEIIKGEKIAF
ncbi:MAG: hypothetical protein C4540_01665 [Candidatus Omnitrophota bacterium]|nr:MAG: hypothetical protein C4540_01665 [Candidatus Omnitrophota bacterium]